MKFILINIVIPILAFIISNQNLEAQVSQTVNGLSSNYIESIKSDDFGIIWIGTNEGLNALIDQQVYEYQSNLINILKPKKVNVKNKIQNKVDIHTAIPSHIHW
mgnify:CR=1 FL=1